MNLDLQRAKKYVPHVIARDRLRPREPTGAAREAGKRDRREEGVLGIVARLEGRLATLELARVHHASENELLRRRLYGTKSERGGTNELQLTLGDMLSEKAALQKQLRDALDKQQAELEQAGDMPDARLRAQPRDRTAPGAPRRPSAAGQHAQRAGAPHHHRGWAARTGSSTAPMTTPRLPRRSSASSLLVGCAAHVGSLLKKGGPRCARLTEVARHGARSRRLCSCVVRGKWLWSSCCSQENHRAFSPVVQIQDSIGCRSPFVPTRTCASETPAV